MNWLELSVTVDPEAVEAVSELLARHGYNGGVVVEPAWTPGDEGPEFSYDSERPVTLRTYLQADADSEQVRQQVAEGLWHLGRMRSVGPLQVRPLAEEDWANAWKQHYSVQRIGTRTVIVPSWLDYAAQPADIVLQLDPGMAFGTGLHPTTRLCVELLEQHVQPGVRTLDLGTGSGILAIAAAKLGAGPLLALDNDPVAVAVAAANVAHNGVGDQVQVAVGSLGAGQHMGHWLSGDFGAAASAAPVGAEMDCGPFNLIVANLIAKVLITLAPDLAAALAPGGRLISSGIIIDREDETALALAAAGLQQRERHRAGEWIAFVHQR